MAKNSWPTAVTSWADTVKFAQLLFGKDVQIEDYSHRLPHSSSQSFLLFAKEACKEPRPFSRIRELIELQLEEIKDYGICTRGNPHNPEKSQQMLSRTGHKVYYYSCQVTKDPCTCRSVFGADAHHTVIPTSSSLWHGGKEFEKLFDATVRDNFGSFGTKEVLPAWFERSWQALWNRNDHIQNHGIAPHSDQSSTYSYQDPITSFSFGHGGILLLTPQTSGNGQKMLFQEDGDVLIMAGKFQHEFFHEVPPRQDWRELCAGNGAGFISMAEWEKRGVQYEIALHESAAGSEQHLRFNCTLRWHHKHYPGCLESAPAAAAVAAVSSPVVSGSDLPLPSAVSGAQKILGIKRREREVSPERQTEVQKSEQAVRILLAGHASRGIG